VPYTPAQIDNAEADLVAQGSADGDTAALASRYGKVQARDYDGNPGRLTEMDALVAYLQMLGTQVQFDAAAAREQAR
jgi:cytochrome c oxidase cbb3-type subunit 2